VHAAAGFWPGNSRVPEPAFFAYAYPEPSGYRSASVRPDTALFHPELGEFFLRYEDVRLVRIRGVPVRGPHELAAIGTEHRKAIKRLVVSDTLESRSFGSYKEKIEVAASPLRMVVMESDYIEELRAELRELLKKQANVLESRSFGTATDTELLEYEIRQEIVHEICAQLAHSTIG